MAGKKKKEEVITLKVEKLSLVKQDSLLRLQKAIYDFDKKIAELKEKRSKTLKLYKQIRKEGG